MLCTICEQEEAVYTVLPTGQGEVNSLGPACFARAGLDVAKAVLPAEEIAAILGPMFVGPAREDLHQVPDLKPRRARKSKATEEPPQGETGGPPEASATAADGGN